MGCNRTIVGLKAQTNGSISHTSLRLQSHHSGIESQNNTKLHHLNRKLQSHHSGIESAENVVERYQVSKVAIAP